MTTRSLIVVVLAYLLSACVAAAPPPGAWGAPAAAAPPSSAPSAGGGLGPTAALSADDARAYYEALVFSLHQVGRADLAAQLDAGEVIAATQAGFPSAAPEVRAVLAGARARWQAIQAAWPTMAPGDRAETVTVVLAIAFGEPAARELVGVATGGAPGAAGAGATGDGDVVVPYEGSDCWGSAGCSYEPGGDGGGTYTFDEPSIPVE